ncbi:MAG TPA: GTP 3',8-cyclase MoaA [Pusillimonas sp.]|jgi:cyclic pyranopterin phosphate synthase|nr:GTP 3',8-cyclase MoaA [Pusillimonas sp.]MBC43145.1 GTP 3',8-cyclase MoaA [Pusillimonas sp.]HBT32083.1 GTP 3',8-cyclase MoaA [Pusillimonas sp.]|tara:strand:- start:66736 stop:67833 length:1098 start_codon:yes stop_codon:yes gene_type:complete
MSKVFYMAPEGRASDVELQTGQWQYGEPLQDTRKRPLRDLRISVTDRCNFRCTYCMPREVFDANYDFMPHASLLSFEEMTRIASVAVSQGVQKIRLTGGEPLLRKDIEKLIAMLSALRTPEGDPVELTLTTNATLLRKKAAALKDAGLNRVTVSLDALDTALFEQMSDSQVPVARVLDGIQAAAEVGLAPVKVNMVVRKGMNDSQILPMAEYFRNSGHVLRFIEYMDVGSTNGWNLDEVVTGKEILALIGAHYPLEPVKADYAGEVAERWRYQDGSGEIGVITSVSHPFCGDCSRARMSPEGRLYLCLFADQGYDLRTVLRGGVTNEALAAHLAGIWQGRTDRYSELRGKETAPRRKIEMSYIGG